MDEFRKCDLICSLLDFRSEAQYRKKKKCLFCYLTIRINKSAQNHALSSHLGRTAIFCIDPKCVTVVVMVGFKSNYKLFPQQFFHLFNVLPFKQLVLDSAPLMEIDISHNTCSHFYCITEY